MAKWIYGGAVAAVLVLASPLATSVPGSHSLLQLTLAEVEHRVRQDSVAGRAWGEATLTAPIGTPFEFLVDWTTREAKIAPLASLPVELPGPDAGCAATEYGRGWIVEPPGLQAFGECDDQVILQWAITRSSLVCALRAGSCGMLATGTSVGPGGPGFFLLLCRGGAAASVKIWADPLGPITGPFGTTNCEVTGLGNDPRFWGLWSGFVANVPDSPSDPSLSWGLNWRFEP